MIFVCSSSAERFHFLVLEEGHDLEGKDLAENIAETPTPTTPYPCSPCGITLRVQFFFGVVERGMVFWGCHNLRGP